jgi:dihydroceramidase
MGHEAHYFWGPVTSTLDWCEENYVSSQFLAEFWNTLTNLGMVFLCVFGLYRCMQNRSEIRVHLAYLGLFIVGLGSWCFHATLQYTWQLADELPMIYGTCLYVYCALEDERKPKHGAILPLALIVYAAAFTYTYMYYLRSPVFHQINYGILVGITIIGFSRQLARLAPAERSRCVRAFVIGMSMFLAGFILWNIDNTFCEWLRATRAGMGPAAPLLQLHGWWHLLTGAGTYSFVTVVAFVRAAVHGRPVRLHLRLGGLLPDVTMAAASRKTR